ncbi:MAG TPA: type II toxin-antitoxin system Phd/YefM family antitoxin [Candidatus Dormibacteraeota bacterium]|nr:type II toxin-antitoxin system Phd/YefM family antitoxin [Candidatus Dormibacteraeota bacterium]
MTDLVNVHDLKTNYSKYLERVADGQEILLGKHGKVVAKIIPIAKAQEPRIPGALKGKVWTSDDFDNPMTNLWSGLEVK